LAHVLSRLRSDKRLRHKLNWCTERYFFADFANQSISHVLQHDGLQCECACASRFRAVNKRALAQRLDRLHQHTAPDPGTYLAEKFGDGHWLALDGQHGEHVLLQLGAALELLRKQAPDATEYGARPGFGQK